MKGFILNSEQRPIFSLWVEYYELLDHFVIRSSLPQELIWYTGRDLLSRTERLRSKEYATEVADVISERLKKEPITKRFYLPIDIVHSNSINRELYLKYLSYISGISSLLDNVYSAYYNSLIYSAMKYHFNRAQFLSFYEFEKELEPISRRQFELALVDQRGVAEYVKYYSRSNLFYHSMESDRNIYLMTTGFDLQLILILSDNELN